MALGVLISVLVALVWFGQGPERLMARNGLPLPASVAPWQLLSAGLLALVPALFLMSALIAAAQCFRMFRDGLYFSRGVALALRAFAARVALSGIAGLTVPTLLRLQFCEKLPPAEQPECQRRALRSYHEYRTEHRPVGE